MISLDIVSSFELDEPRAVKGDGGRGETINQTNRFAGIIRPGRTVGGGEAGLGAAPSFPTPGAGYQCPDSEVRYPMQVAGSGHWLFVFSGLLIPSVHYTWQRTAGAGHWLFVFSGLLIPSVRCTRPRTAGAGH